MEPIEAEQIISRSMERLEAEAVQRSSQVLKLAAAMLCGLVQEPEIYLLGPGFKVTITRTETTTPTA